MKIYQCFLNGKSYGIGNLEYIHELFKDYVITCQMYGRTEIKFEIKEVGEPGD